jgi:hypothetical protein
LRIYRKRLILLRAFKRSRVAIGETLSKPNSQRQNRTNNAKNHPFVALNVSYPRFTRHS